MSRPPNHEFQEWWNKQRENEGDQFINATSSSSSSSSSASTNGSESRSFLAIDVDADRAAKKDRSRSARQLWRIYLRRFRHFCSSVTGGLVTVLRRANRRVAESDRVHRGRSRSKLYWLIKIFLVVVLVLLVGELGAFFNGWHFRRPTVEEVEEAEEEVIDLTKYVYANWLQLRAAYLAPPLQSMANMCIVLFIIQSLDRIVLVLGCLWIKLWGLKPEPGSDELFHTQNPLDFPMVLVQIPMCNEREVRRCRFHVQTILV